MNNPPATFRITRARTDEDLRRLALEMPLDAWLDEFAAPDSDWIAGAHYNTCGMVYIYYGAYLRQYGGTKQGCIRVLNMFWDKINAPRQTAVVEELRTVVARSLLQVLASFGDDDE